MLTCFLPECFIFGENWLHVSVTYSDLVTKSPLDIIVGIWIEKVYSNVLGQYSDVAYGGGERGWGWGWEERWFTVEKT